MIPEVKIRGLDFISTEYEEAVWSYISNIQHDIRGEFIITFHGESSDEIKIISASAIKHANSLRIRTNIVLSRLCRKFVFLDITSNDTIDNSSEFRFQIRKEAPVNIIHGLRFIKDHMNHIATPIHHSNEKRQKRNDSSEFNYNK